MMLACRRVDVLPDTFISMTGSWHDANIAAIIAEMLIFNMLLQNQGPDATKALMLAVSLCYQGPDASRVGMLPILASAILCNCVL